MALSQSVPVLNKMSTKPSTEFIKRNQSDNNDSDIPQLYEDMKFPLHNYVMLSPYETLNRSTLKQEMSINSCYYKDGEDLLPIPFVFAQPEGMPCWIKGLDDIANMSENDVKVFLRGYDKSLEGTLDELKRNLAVTVGVPIDDADKRFNYKGPPGLPPDYYHNIKINPNASVANTVVATSSMHD